MGSDRDTDTFEAIEDLLEKQEYISKADTSDLYAPSDKDSSASEETTTDEPARTERDRRWAYHDALRDSGSDTGDLFDESTATTEIEDPFTVWQDAVDQRHSITYDAEDREEFEEAVAAVRADCGIEDDNVADQHWLFPILAKSLEKVRHGDYVEDLPDLLEPVAAVTIADGFEDYHTLEQQNSHNSYLQEGEARIDGRRVTGHNAGKNMEGGVIESSAVYGHNTLNDASDVTIQDSLVAGHHPLKGGTGSAPSFSSPRWSRKSTGRSGTYRIEVENSILVGHSVLENAKSVSVEGSIIATRYGDLTDVDAELTDTYVVNRDTVAYYRDGHARDEPDHVIALDGLYDEVRLD